MNFWSTPSSTEILNYNFNLPIIYLLIFTGSDFAHQFFYLSSWEVQINGGQNILQVFSLEIATMAEIKVTTSQ